MIDVDTRIDPRSLRLLEDALKAADRKTGDATEKSVNRAMWFIGRSAGAAAKPRSMAAKREVIKNTSPNRQKKKQARYLIKVLHQDKPPTFLPANRKSDPRRKIARLGLASSVFRYASGKFGKRQKGGKTVRGVKKWVSTHQAKTSRRIVARISVWLSYLETAFPGIADTAIRKGMASFVRGFDRDWATSLKEGGW